MLEIKTNAYHVWNDEANSEVRCAGSFRLNGVEDYQPVIALFTEVATHNNNDLTLNLTELEFLNSSGINALSRFVISLRGMQGSQLKLRGSKKIAWQGKSLPNLGRLLPSMQLELQD